MKKEFSAEYVLSAPLTDVSEAGEDFLMSSVALHSIHGLTSGIELFSTTSAKAVEVVEFGEQTLVFHLNAKAISGQLIAMKGTVVIDKKTSPFEATGRITTLSSVTDKLNRFEILLQQFDRPQWKRLLEARQQNQSRADKIFTSIRGDD